MRFALCTAAFVLSLASAAALRAQPVMQPFYPGFAGLPPYEVLAIVRSAGFDPVSRPVRQGPVYVLRALSPADQEVRVVVDARMGRIVKVAAVAASDPGAFAPPEAIPGRVMPDSNVPGPPLTEVPHGTAENPNSDRARPGLLDPPPRTSVRAGAKSSPPPLPRPRPKEAIAAEFPPTPAPPVSTGATASTQPSASTGPSASAENTAPWGTGIDE